MNFFESQDVAKRKTGRLIFLFAMAVLSLILVTNLLVMFLLGFFSTELSSMAAVNGVRFSWEIFAGTGLLVAVIILLGSMYKIVALSGGGSRIAEMMNGRLLVAGSDDLKERRLLNVVEEMAIASGTPVPPVYLMEEDGINAFAAGYSPSDAVIGITRGALDTLNREQLQGVIAHEFSHILHGDMRINIRLIGVLHGIMVLGIIGYHLLRSGSHGRRSKESGGIVAIGVGLLVIGYVGTFFGNLIKAAVSRQREYLADASAVQFTRNPDGIAGALMQIGQHSGRSYLQHPGSNEISHALFEEGKASRLSSLYATHPPLEQRISAILPNWDGSYDLLASSAARGAAVELESAAPASDLGAKPSRAESLTDAIVTGAILADQLSSQAGNPESVHLGYAEALLQEIPAQLRTAAREPSGARAVIYLLVLSSDGSEQTRQLEFLQNSADAGVYDELQAVIQYAEQLRVEHRLPLVEICLAALRQLSPAQYELFRSNFESLIKQDNKISLFEWSLQNLLFHHLRAVFDKSYRPRFGKKDIGKCSDSISLLLSVLVHASRQNNTAVESAFKAGADLLQAELNFLSTEDISFKALNAALDELNQLKPLQKPALLKACAACIEADGQVLPLEVELLRAVAASLDCPVPPLLAQQ